MEVSTCLLDFFEAKSDIQPEKKLQPDYRFFIEKLSLTFFKKTKTFFEKG